MCFLSSQDVDEHLLWVSTLRRSCIFVAWLVLLTCAAALLEVEESSSAAVTFGSGDAGLAPTLAHLVAVKRLGTKGVTVARSTHPTRAEAVSLRLQRRRTQRL